MNYLELQLPEFLLYNLANSHSAITKSHTSVWVTNGAIIHTLDIVSPQYLTASLKKFIFGESAIFSMKHRIQMCNPDKRNLLAIWEQRGY